MAKKKLEDKIRTNIDKLKKRKFTLSDVQTGPIRACPYKSVYNALRRLTEKGVIEKDVRGKWKRVKRMKSGKVKKHLTKTSFERTIKIDPKFAIFGNWTTRDLEKRGFRLMQVSISGQGLSSGHSQYTNLQVVTKKLPGGRKIVFDNLKHRKYDAFCARKYGHSEYDHVMKIILKEWGFMQFSIHKMILKSGCGTIFHFKCLQGTEKSEPRALYLHAVDGERYHPDLHPDAPKILDDLFWNFCEEKKGVNIGRVICDASHKLNEQLEQEPLGTMH